MMLAIVPVALRRVHIVGWPNDLRFWLKVDRSRGPDACWPWLGAVDKDGYGKFQTGPRGQQVSHRSHRYAYELEHGPIPEGLLALHSCDCPPCCNPRHIEAGTQKKNREDCVSRGRTARGERHAMAKLTVGRVYLIRALLTTSASGVDIARIAEVDPQSVYTIKTRRLWSWLA